MNATTPGPRAPSTTLRAVLLPRFAGEESGGAAFSSPAQGAGEGDHAKRGGGGERTSLDPERSTLADPRAAWLVRLGDATLILGHRMSEWLSRAPTLEEDVAMANLSLDLIGQTRAFYTRACELEGGDHDETTLAYHRAEPDYRNPLIVEQPNGNFADSMARHLIFSAYAAPLYQKLAGSNDGETAGIATRSAREMAYHLRHAGEWMIRLGDGTAESRDKAQAALDDLWPYVPELFEADDLDRDVAASGFGVDPSTLRGDFDAAIDDLLGRAKLNKPAERRGQRGGKSGLHSEHLGHILATLQFLQRAYPAARW